MFDRELARTVVGIIGNIISVILFLSPLATFKKIIKHKDVKEFKPDPYVMTFLNCAMWCVYGLPFVKPDSVLVLTINGFGFVLELVYISIFFAFSPWIKRRKLIISLLAEVVFFVAVVLVAFLVFHTPTKRATFVGTLCIIFNVLMYASPLTVMKMVIQTKSVKYMPFCLSFAAFWNGIVWTGYALLRFDINILVPNGLGTLFSLLQLALYGIYYRTTKWEEDDDVALPPPPPAATATATTAAAAGGELNQPEFSDIQLTSRV
ncbi:Bidirectional sugar transporter SWEET5 [Linum grandiflorum]